MGNVRKCVHGRIDDGGECSCSLYFTSLPISYANYQECEGCDDYEVEEDEDDFDFDLSEEED